MSTPVRIERIEQLPAAVAAMIGFVPSDSIVVLPIDGGPVARVDLADSIVALTAAFGHWSTVILVVYSDDLDDAGRVGLQAGLHLPLSITVRDIVHVSPIGQINGGAFADEVAPGALAAHNVLPSREALVAEAETIDDPAVALDMALAAYEVGNGSRAWTFLDRHVVLAGEPNEQAIDLTNRLYAATPPPVQS